MRSEVMAPRTTQRVTAAAGWCAATVALCLSLAACGGDSSPTCGAGTKRVDGVCMPVNDAPSCGKGTVQQGSTCAPIMKDAGSSDTSASPDAFDKPNDAVQDAGPKSCDPACGATEQCVAGVCEPLPVPPTWICTPSAFGDNSVCNCDCGAPDPDCLDKAHTVVGCKSGACEADGTCAACVPKCDSKDCGADGCGGQCGFCTDPTKSACIDGACQACTPQCKGKTCGLDGCGGNCGACDKGTLCKLGTCVFPTATESCFGHCGGLAPSGCACTADCDDNDNCCADVGTCGCLPKCDGKSCGDDGCGGACACEPGNVCTAGTCLLGACQPDTCNGHGKCKPATATCDCDATFSGPFCDSCGVGLVGFPNCVTPCTDDAGCDDGNSCTGDFCSATNGCINLPIPVTCSDADACTMADTCTGTTCKGSATDCDDGNACTADSCAAKSGCVHLASGATACDDGDPCTTGDACTGAKCKGNGTADCNDGNICTNDGCDPSTKAGCAHLASGATCTTGGPCSVGASCNGATCVSLGTKSCDDSNPCTIDACGGKDGTCSNKLAAAGTSCDDDNLCTSGETCDAKGGCGSGATICSLTVTKGLTAHYTAGFAVTLAHGADKRLLTWKDLSSNKRDVSAIDTAKAPLVATSVIHGRRGVRFAGSAGMKSASFSVPASASVFAVFCVESGAKLGPLLGHGNPASAWSLGKAAGVKAPSVGVVTGGTNSVGSIALNHKGLGATSDGKHHCFVAVARVGPAQHDLQLIGTESVGQSAKGKALATAKAALLMGADDKGVSGGVVLGEVLYYDRAVNDSERDAITSYLRTAWGFDPPKPDFGWYDATDPSTVVTKDGRVTLWKDKSGLGRHAAPASAKTGPVYFKVGTSNGRPALRFDGSSVRLQTKSVPTASQMTLFAVFEMDKPQPWACVFAQGHDTWFSLRKSHIHKGQLLWQAGKNYGALGVPVPLATWKLWTAVQTDKQSTLYNDPTKPFTVIQGPIKAGKEKLSLGNAHVSNESLGGFIAEIRAYSRALDASDIAFVESLLRRRYGL